MRDMSAKVKAKKANSGSNVGKQGNAAEKRDMFPKWLEFKKKELGFKKTDMMKATGIGSTTIDNYFAGASYPDDEYRSRIVRFIYDLSEFEGFKRIPNKEFTDLFYSLMDEFAYEVNQDKLSKATGITQSNISKLQNGKYIPTTAMQKMILEFFYEMTVDSQGEFLIEHEDMGYELKSHLMRYFVQRDYIESEFYECFGNGELLVETDSVKYYGECMDGEVFKRWQIKKSSPLERELDELAKAELLKSEKNIYDMFYVDGETQFTEAEHEHAREYSDERKRSIFLFKQYPEKIQKTILDNIRAFCDNYYFLREEDDEYYARKVNQGERKDDGPVYFYSFYQAKNFMERFRELPEGYKWDIIIILEERIDEALNYWSNYEEKEFFMQVTDLQKMVLLTDEGWEVVDYYRENALSSEKMSFTEAADLGVPTLNSIRFAKLCSELLEYDVIEEINYKLGFDSREWYLWLLIVKATFYDIDWEDAFDELPEDEFE